MFVRLLLFNCSSVAARPFVAKSVAVTVVLDKPVISFVVPPVTVTVPVLIVPAVPSRVILLAPTPVVTLSFVITVLLPKIIFNRYRARCCCCSICTISNRI